MSMCFRDDDTAILAIHEGELLKYNTQSRELATIPFPGERKTFYVMWSVSEMNFG